MKRRYLRIVIAGVIFLLALLLTLYPVISNLYNQEHQSQIQTAYREVLEQTDTSELERIRKEAIAYNAAITPGTVEEAYSQESIQMASEDYVNQLNVSGSGIMGYVEIPKIGVDLPIYHGTGADSLDRGTGHLLGSSLPVGGESTHTIITGHSGMASQKMFTDLEQLREECFILLEPEDNAPVEPQLRQAGVRGGYRVKDDYTILAMVESGLGVSVLPHLLLQRTSYRVYAARLMPPVARRMGILLPKEGYVSLAARQFVSFLRQEAEAVEK